MTKLTDQEVIRVHPCARLYRRKYDLSKITDKAGVIYDTCIFWFYMLQNPKMMYVDKVMSAYNHTGTGISTGSSKIYNKSRGLEAIFALRNALEKQDIHEKHFYLRFKKMLKKRHRFAFTFLYMLNKEHAYHAMLKKYTNLAKDHD